MQGLEDTIFRGCGTHPSRRNRVELLNDAGEMYASLLAALHRARHTICLEYYIFDDDRIGRTISDVLIRRARGGVKVRLIYDLLGSWMPAWGMLRELRKAGVEVCYFRKFQPRHPWQWINVRNHRKIAVIDNRIAFLGGINIARRYLEGTELGHWRDEHLRIEGEAVTDLSALFERDWRAVGGVAVEPIVAEGPAIDPGRQCRLTIAWSEEGKSRRVVERCLVRMVRSARREVMLSSPYYIPTPPLRAAIRAALLRGVRVLLMTPARADLRLAAWTSDSFYREFLSLGGVVYRYENGFLHTKLVVVDRRLTCIGTANLDYRSMRTNWEVAAFISDKSFGKEVARTFLRDCRQCTQLDSEEWGKRPLLSRMLSHFGRLFVKIL